MQLVAAILDRIIWGIIYVLLKDILVQFKTDCYKPQCN